MIIDAHAHIFKGDKTKLLKEMRKAGISKALILDYFDHEETGYSAGETIKITKKEKKFLLAGTVDMERYTEKDLKFLERNLKNNNYATVKLYPGYQHIYPADKKLEPIYRLCIKYDKPAVFHTGEFADDEKEARMDYSKPKHLEDVAQEFPKMDIVIAHLGNPFWGQARKLLRRKNVFGDLSGLFEFDGKYGNAFEDKEYNEEVRKRLNSFIKAVGLEKVMFGTDFNLAEPDKYVKFVKSLDFSKADLEHIFYKNAMRIYKF
jgi:predicted TIM-barrel fold metal-dependent hydrolase